MRSRRFYVHAGSLAAAVVLLAAQPAGAVGQRARGHLAAFQTTQTFRLGAGRASSTFRFHERSGVILVNRLTVPHGVRGIVEARIPQLAGARVTSWPSRNDPSLSCRH